MISFYKQYFFRINFVIQNISLQIMQTQNIFIAHPKTVEQINALKAVVKAFKIDFEVTREDNKSLFVEELQESLNQVQDIKSGKLPKQSIKDFLNEL